MADLCERQEAANTRLETVVERFVEITDEHRVVPEHACLRDAQDAEDLADAMEAGLAQIESSLDRRRRRVIADRLASYGVAAL